MLEILILIALGAVSVFGVLNGLRFIAGLIIGIPAILFLYAVSKTGFYVGAAFFLVWALGQIWLGYLDRSARSEDQRRWKPSAAALAAEQRERMIAEGELIEPNIYRHPSGVFIARNALADTRTYKTLRGARDFSAR